ncbi:chondroitinase family polysaccharide lyase [Paenibacillus filicis]|uniref:Chondroitinase family polysaccharide lyase n=1 Tax=Paenibacillus gyeongsangnamensis TaxID=3388067 RepID=A0ABT4QBL1_9BACL|nr:chondroitinase family polysaccharide lyase [Paenibacillus filicis]MCZ8514256.1 chondroitinase family polysaccharide lyase [Paenibacillus filicis]
MVIFSFESGIPACFSCDGQSRLSISDRHYKDGASSLQWEYGEASFITLKQPIGYRPFQEGAKNQARDSFAVWIYNPAPHGGKLAFEFGRGGQTVDCSFEFELNFRGWRAAWVAYERDMGGTPHPDMDTLTLRMPKGAEPGTLFIDQLMLNTPIDPRFHTRDFQVPFVNTGADVSANAHWLALYAFEQLKPLRAVPVAVTSEQSVAHARMNERFEALFYEKSAVTVTQEDVESLRRRFAEYGIVRSGDSIMGRPVELPFFDHYPQPLKEELKSLSSGVQLSEITRFLMKTAVIFRSSEREEQQAELQAMFLDALDHLDDQGWTYGSSQGTVHHFGYNFRDYYPAVFLMRDVLKAAGRLERTQRTMRWYSGAGRIHTPLAEVEGNIDIFNTTLHGMIASLLIMDETAEKVRELEAFRDWLSQSLLPAPGLRAAYKIDGSAYHHVNHYPAYAVGGFQGVTPVMYVLSGTPYRVGEQAHETIRKALLAMRLYSNKREWLLSLAARHPTGKWALDPEPFGFLAQSGTSDGTGAIDEEAAAAYLRLLGPDERTEAARRFEEAGIVPEPDPSGHWTMNYAALAIHRRGSWLAGMRGHSRYLWANETYVNANLYGRYITHGHLQIMSQGEPVNNEDSGYHHDGWDWNRWPGTTTVHKPIAELRSDVRNVDTFSGFEEMLLSDETYAGGLHLENRNGMFAMKLHEHPKYEGSHRARKSAFFFDDRIVCLGTGIENDNGACPTETTLFQNHLTAPDHPIWVNSTEPIAVFGYFQRIQLTKPAWIVDNKRNGYYVAAGQTLSISKETQHSKHQATDADTYGDFAAAWLEHGTAPKDGSYEYAILVGADRERMLAFYKHMQAPETAAYRVLRQDRAAHVVRDAESRTTAYALFEADDPIDTGHLVAVDNPSMVMIREDGDRLIISAVNPDLRLYAGIEADQYDEHGVRKEVSVYSRKWVHRASMAHTMRITLKGQWMKQAAADGFSVIAGEAGNTVIELTCKDAMPREFALVKAAMN